MKIDVKTKNGTFSFECEGGEKVLYAGLRHGVPLPYECATGTCGTCKGRSQGGCVDDGWADAPGRSYLKTQRGEFLMCQARVLSSCQIVVPSRLAEPEANGVRPDYAQGTIHGIQRLNEDVADFRVVLEKAMVLRAGQFVVLETPDVEGFRAYSMVNHSDAAVDELHFVVKRKPGGAFSSQLFDGAIDGARVCLFGPLGKAVFDPSEAKNVLCIAGGSGIAGMMAILSQGCRSGYFREHSGFVFFGVRTMADAFYLDELDGYVAQNPGSLYVCVAFSDEDASDTFRTRYPRLNFDTGFVHKAAAEQMRGRYDNTVAFVAGPPPMVDGALRMLIIEGRLPASDIRYDKFG
jgi:toluene monooxygenase electron transfer component